MLVKHPYIGTAVRMTLIRTLTVSNRYAHILLLFIIYLPIRKSNSSPGIELCGTFRYQRNLSRKQKQAQAAKRSIEGQRITYPKKEKE